VCLKNLRTSWTADIVVEAVSQMIAGQQIWTAPSTTARRRS